MYGEVKTILHMQQSMRLMTLQVFTLDRFQVSKHDSRIEETCKPSHLIAYLRISIQLE